MAETFVNGSESGSGNSTESAAIVESDCSVFTFVLYVVVFGTVVVFGLVGNGLSWFVLAWDRRDRGRVASFLLRTRHGTGSLGHRVNGSFGSSFTPGSPGHHFDPV